MNFPQRLIAKTLHGLEHVLADELTELGAQEVQVGKRAVACSGDLGLVYRANYELRTALRILVPLTEFAARDERQLYARVRDRVDWSHYLDPDGSLAVDAVVQSQVFRHSRYLALTVKDAIVDQFRDRYGRRPDVDTEFPKLRIHLHVHENHCSLALDASGDSLHKRCYRRHATEAPINEVLAAGMLKLAKFDGKTPFIDPMCGSGTIVIEAAMLARRMPAQFLRSGFGFFRWKNFDKKLWQQVKSTADKKMQPADCQIFASDIDPASHNTAAVNLLAAGLEADVVLQKKDFMKRLPPTDTPGLLITNPPYDERLKMEDSCAFYAQIGERLKHQWHGWTAWLITSNREALQALHLRPSARHTLFNGKLECSFQKYEMYEGKKNKDSAAAGGHSPSL